jgi:hypothetical protein
MPRFATSTEESHNQHSGRVAEVCVAEGDRKMEYVGM